MPVERLTPERRRQLTREALVAAAAEVFAQKGFHGASLDEIADAAGFTRGAIYSNFGSKEELLFAVSDRLDDLTLAGMADAIDEKAGDPVSVAEAAASVWGRLAGRSRELVALTLELRLYALRNPGAQEKLATLESDLTDKLAAFIEEAFSRQRLPLQADARDLAEIGRAAMEGLEQLAALTQKGTDGGTPLHTDRYRRLVRMLFTLLARAASDPASAAEAAPTAG